MKASLVHINKVTRLIIIPSRRNESYAQRKFKLRNVTCCVDSPEETKELNSLVCNLVDAVEIKFPWRDFLRNFPAMFHRMFSYWE